MGLIHDIPTVDDLVHRIIDEAAEASSKNMSIFNGKEDETVSLYGN